MRASKGFQEAFIFFNYNTICRAASLERDTLKKLEAVAVFTVNHVANFYIL